MTVAGISEITQYLTFRLDDEIFGMDITTVREILDMTNVTKMPKTPKYVRGVINLRERGVPIIDLKIMLGMARTETTASTCIIITEVTIDNESILLGAMADSVREVVDLEPDQIKPAPKLGGRLRMEFIKGMGRIGNDFILLLDIDQVFLQKV
jgi:purine-binding chemotaxis protein CheW